MPVTNIAETRTETPDTIATTVARETDTHWWVECEEPGCENVITVGKSSYRPVDFAHPQTTDPHVRTDFTAPPARRCRDHGPRLSR